MGYAVAAVLVAVILPRLETRFLPELVSPVSAPAAMAICSSVASGMIALTGIVFSLAFVMVQFSATAYSPRLVLWVARDPVMSHALGVFTATFLYALALLAWVDRANSGKVPLHQRDDWCSLFSSPVWVCSSPSLSGSGCLQVNRMLIFTGDQGRKAIDALYPQCESTDTPSGLAEYRGLGVTGTLSSRRTAPGDSGGGRGGLGEPGYRV